MHGTELTDGGRVVSERERDEPGLARRVAGVCMETAAVLGLSALLVGVDLPGPTALCLLALFLLAGGAGALLDGYDAVLDETAEDDREEGEGGVAGGRAGSGAGEDGSSWGGLFGGWGDGGGF